MLVLSTASIMIQNHSSEWHRLVCNRWCTLERNYYRRDCRHCSHKDNYRQSMILVARKCTGIEIPGEVHRSTPIPNRMLALVFVGEATHTAITAPWHACRIAKFIITEFLNGTINGQGNNPLIEITCTVAKGFHVAGACCQTIIVWTDGQDSEIGHIDMVNSLWKISVETIVGQDQRIQVCQFFVGGRNRSRNRSTRNIDVDEGLREEGKLVGESTGQTDPP